MRLSTLYEQMTPAERITLAGKAKISAGYLYQLATRFRNCRPSMATLSALLGADKRLTSKDLLAEFSDPQVKEKA